MIRRMFVAGMALALAAGVAQAQEVKVGVVLPYTGIGAEFAQQMDRGMELYLKLNADQVKPYTIKLIKRDAKDSERRRRQDRGPGTADAGQGRCPRRLGLFARMRSRRRRSSPPARSSR